MKSHLLPLAFIALASNVAFAHSHETCTMTNKDSCWFAYNTSAHTAQISCIDSYNTTFKTQLNSQGNYSYQYCTGWGDGLGYPEPGVVSKCSVELAHGKKINFQITSIFWGNPVEFNIDDDKVTVKISSWYPGAKEVIHTFNFE